jgi:hypothetical protein
MNGGRCERAEEESSPGGMQLASAHPRGGGGGWRGARGREEVPRIDRDVSELIKRDGPHGAGVATRISVITSLSAPLCPVLNILSASYLLLSRPQPAAQTSTDEHRRAHTSTQPGLTQPREGFARAKLAEAPIKRRLRPYESRGRGRGRGRGRPTLSTLLSTLIRDRRSLE